MMTQFHWNERSCFKYNGISVFLTELVRDGIPLGSCRSLLNLRHLRRGNGAVLLLCHEGEHKRRLCGTLGWCNCRAAHRNLRTEKPEVAQVGMCPVVYECRCPRCSHTIRRRMEFAKN